MGQHLVSEFARVLKTNTEDYLKGAAEALPQVSILLGQLKKRGRVIMGKGGINVNWKVRKGRHGLSKVTDAQPFSITRTSLYDEAKMDFWGYKVGDAISEREMLKNKYDKTRLIDVWGGMVEQCKDDFNRGFNAKLYLNGETTTYLDDIHGLETIFSLSTATIPTGGTTYKPVLTSGFGSNTYGGIELDASYTPTGGSANYYWMPTLIIDANSASFGAGGWLSSNAYKIFDAGCVEHSYKNDSKFPQLAIMSKLWYRLLRLSLFGKESIVINRPSGVAETSDDFGFRNMVLDGVPAYAEPNDWPTMKQGGAEGCYLLNLDKLSLEVLGDNWFNVHMQEDVTAGLVNELVITHYSRLRTESPFFQTKIVDKG